MLFGARNRTLYRDFAGYIRAAPARRAFEILVGVAATSTKYDGLVRCKGTLRDFRFRQGKDVHYAFSVDREWLTFWFRAPALKTGKHSSAQLARDFPSFNGNPNVGNEWTVKLYSVADVERLLKHVDLT